MTNNNVGIYLHIPFCKSRCDYCAFVSCTNLSNQRLYVESLKREIFAKKEFLVSKEISTANFSDGGISADTVYFGGGTPSMLKSGYFTEILNALKGAFKVLPNAEITTEANPDSATKEFLHECAAAGVNRLSLGVQTADDEILKRINRPHNFSQFIAAVKNAKSEGIKNISCDLMLGLPGDTLSGAVNSVKKILEQGVKHISVYSLKVEEGTRLYGNFCADEDLQADMYDAVVEILEQAGYNRYEVSNFAMTGYESKHNLKYWNRLPYIGFGAAAHSFYNDKRIENTENISKYNAGNYGGEVTDISREDGITEYIMLGLRTRDGIDIQILKNQYSHDILKVKSKEIANLLKLNVITIEDNRLKLTKSAFYIMNSIICQLT